MGIFDTWAFKLITQFVLPVVGLWVMWKSRSPVPRKEFSFGVLNKKILLDASEDIRDDVQLSYKGRAVYRLTSLTIAVMNTGKAPILKTDFQGSGKVQFFGDDVCVLGAEVIGCNPNHINHDVSHSDSELVFGARLFNPGDYLTIRTIVDAKDLVYPRFSTAITDVAKMPCLREGRHPGFDIVTIGFWVLFLLFVIGVIPLMLKDRGMTWGNGLFMFVFLTLPILALISAFRDLRRTLRTRWMGKDVES